MENSSREISPEWVFGYGSLMWNPGFSYLDKCSATLKGYQRRFCIYSHYYRGTTKLPGLVLGLNPGGECRGIAFRISINTSYEIISYLDKRELIGYAYKPALLPIVFDSGKSAIAHTYITDHTHPNFAGPISNEVSTHLITCAKGIAGSNQDYVLKVVRELETNCIIDIYLQNILNRLRQTKQKK